MVKFGIAITTYNRPQHLARQLAAIKLLTTEDYILVICDDGSSYDLESLSQTYNAVLIRGENRGVAWNKNRGLFYLMNYTGAETIILLDDDVMPARSGWEQEWIRACELYGHVTHAIPNEPYGFRGGEANAAIPSISACLLGQALGFHRSVIAEIGYMDTRFGKYGFEHIEFTQRAVSAGYGGFFEPAPLFFKIEGGLQWDNAESNGDAALIEENKKIYDQIVYDHIHRFAWRNPEEYEILMSEMRAATKKSRGLSYKGAQAYIDRYPDLGPSITDAVLHWLTRGREEGRSWGEDK
jgi:glycosyltransferase involved in cell wall biosynthesis